MCVLLLFYINMEEGRSEQKNVVKNKISNQSNNRRRRRRRNKSKSARFESVRVCFFVRPKASLTYFFSAEERLDTEKQEESVTSYKNAIVA